MSKPRDLWQEVIELWTAALMRSRGGDREGARRALEAAFARCTREVSEQALFASTGPLDAEIDARMAATICLSSGRTALEDNHPTTALVRFWTGLRLMADAPDFGLKHALRLACMEALAQAAHPRQGDFPSSTRILAILEESTCPTNPPLSKARLALARAALPDCTDRARAVALEAMLEDARAEARRAGAVGLEASALLRLGQHALARGDAENARRHLEDVRHALVSISDQEGLAWLRLDQARLRLLQGRPLAARAHCVKARRLFKRSGGAEGLQRAQAALRLLPLWWVLWVVLGGGRRRLGQGGENQSMD